MTPTHDYGAGGTANVNVNTASAPASALHSRFNRGDQTSSPDQTLLRGNASNITEGSHDDEDDDKNEKMIMRTRMSMTRMRMKLKKHEIKCLPLRMVPHAQLQG